ncbi:hypothetical protein ZIOFF_047577 [Zingiber officinale]|uniref:Exonuclease 1 n=1 Tax=Zingiber officinale TaxID=94328 RepID=A0A8J5FY47_ZINOF|nr:hypothetical protein ZIOFF_047577 [Zingiber officinale]
MVDKSFARDVQSNYQIIRSRYRASCARIYFVVLVTFVVCKLVIWRELKSTAKGLSRYPVKQKLNPQLFAKVTRKHGYFNFWGTKVLEELRLTMDQFIDLCILSGCDYCDNIKGRAIREA